MRVIVRTSAFGTIKPYSAIQTKLIENSLANVYKYGWSQNSIIAACQNLDLSPACHRIIQPYDMIAYSMNKWNQQALRQIDDSNFQGNKRIRDKIHYAIKTRLTFEIQYADTWHQAMALGAHPSNLLTTKNLLWEYSDDIWVRCGDKSTDYNYYSKRTLFNAAYAATELHLLTDQSTEKFATWEFLDRRLDDILTMGKNISQLKTVTGAALDGILSLTTMFSSPPRIQTTPNQPIKTQSSQSVKKQ